MTQLLTAIGVAMVIEGALYALLPNGMKKIMLHVLAQPLSHLRTGGVFTACLGLGLVWLIRG